MAHSARKERELQQREDLILDTAQRILLDDGWLGLTMDRIAEITEYAKGTIYNHFDSREDLLAALTVRNMRRRMELVGRAAAYRGGTRERMSALILAEEIYVRAFPFHGRALQVIQVASLLGKTMGERQTQIGREQARLIDVFGGVTRDAIAQGDIEFVFPRKPEQLIFALAGIWFGVRGLMDTPWALCEIDKPFDVAWTACHAVLDGFSWRPLSTEQDYLKTRKSILQQVFPEERKRLKLT